MASCRRRRVPRDREGHEGHRRKHQTTRCCDRQQTLRRILGPPSPGEGNRRIKESAAARIAAAAEEHVAEADEAARNTTHARSRPGRRMSTISALLADDAVARERWSKALYQDDTDSAHRKAVIENGSRVRIVKVDHNHRKVAIVAKVKRKGMFEVRLVQEN